MNAKKNTATVNARNAQLAKAREIRSQKIEAEKNAAKQAEVQATQDELFAKMVSAISGEVLKNLMPAIEGIAKQQVEGLTQKETVSVPKLSPVTVEANKILAEMVQPANGTNGNGEEKRRAGRPMGSKSTRSARPAISPWIFKKAFTNAGSVDDVIEMFPELKSLEPEHARQYVISHAAYLRKNGVNLKYLPRGRAAHRS